MSADPDDPPLTLATLMAAEERIAMKHQEYRNAVAGAEILLESAKYRAIEIVRACKSLTGVPFYERYLGEGDVRLHYKRKLVIVTTHSYHGEGIWEANEKKIRFPIRWLAMSDADVKAELGAWLASRKAYLAGKKAAQEKLAEEAAAEAKRVRDIAEYERLKALFEPSP